MQVQKDDVRNKIIAAATEEFLNAGYQQSSMRNIAAEAGITVGNVYAYFGGKDALFESIISPVWQSLNRLISIPVDTQDLMTLPTINQITDLITETFLENRPQFLILMNKSAGSPYKNARAELSALVSGRLSRDILPQCDPLLADAMAGAILEGFFTVFNHYGGDANRLRTLISELLGLLLGSIPCKYPPKHE